MNLLTNLGIKHPLILAPMAGGPSTPELAAAVSQQGGLGSLAGSYLTPAKLSADIRRIRAFTAAPFAINLFVPSPEPTVLPSDLDNAYKVTQVYRDELGLPQPELRPPFADAFHELMTEVLEARPALFSFAFGLAPVEAIQECRRRGILTAGTATNITDAVTLQDAGVDAVICQGIEAGGHRSLFAPWEDDAAIGTIALVRLAVTKLRVPVIASGGIMDGQGIAAALSLGAQAAQLGTAFLACPEAGTSPPYKAALLAPGPKMTRLTRVFSGRWARGIENRFMREIPDSSILPFPVQNSLTRDIRKQAAADGNADLLSLWAGQGVDLIRSMPAAELVTKLVDEIKNARRL